jgi:hypothetical protein
MIHDTQLQIFISGESLVAIKHKTLSRARHITLNSINQWPTKIAYSSKKYYSTNFHDRFYLRSPHAAMLVLSVT